MAASVKVPFEEPFTVTIDWLAPAVMEVPPVVVQEKFVAFVEEVPDN